MGSFHRSSSSNCRRSRQAGIWRPTGNQLTVRFRLHPQADYHEACAKSTPCTPQPLRCSRLTRASVSAFGQTLTQPPIAPMREYVREWHGEKVDDPWFWLREKDSTPGVDDLKAENAYTEAAAEDLALMTGRLYKEMLGRIKETDLDVPVRRGSCYYCSRTVKGLQYPIHPIRCRRPATAARAYDAKAPEQVLIDLNTMAKGKAYISLGDMKVSDNAFKAASRSPRRPH